MDLFSNMKHRSGKQVKTNKIVQITKQKPKKTPPPKKRIKKKTKLPLRQFKSTVKQQVISRIVGII